MVFERDMAKKRVGLGPVKRFGVRYGRTVKIKRAAIEVMQKNSTKCPYCSKHQVKRQAKGIWQCGKCDNKFTGQAYTFETKKPTNKFKTVQKVMIEKIKVVEE